jgi:hypothetical protein
MPDQTIIANVGLAERDDDEPADPIGWLNVFFGDLFPI